MAKLIRTGVHSAGTAVFYLLLLVTRRALAPSDVDKRRTYSATERPASTVSTWPVM